MKNKKLIIGVVIIIVSAVVLVNTELQKGTFFLAKRIIPRKASQEQPVLNATVPAETARTPVPRKDLMIESVTVNYNYSAFPPYIDVAVSIKNVGDVTSPGNLDWFNRDNPYAEVNACWSSDGETCGANIGINHPLDQRRLQSIAPDDTVTIHSRPRVNSFEGGSLPPNEARYVIVSVSVRESRDSWWETTGDSYYFNNNKIVPLFAR